MAELLTQLSIYYRSSLSLKDRNELFESIWNEYAGRVTVYAKMLLHCGEADIEDTVQEIMIKTYKNLHTFKPLFSFETWLFRIARNHCIDKLKRRKPVMISTEEASENRTGISGPGGEKSASGPYDPVEKREELAAVEAYLGTLDKQDRELAYFRFYENFSYRRISRILGRPPGTLKYRIHEIRKGLKQFLEKDHG